MNARILKIQNGYKFYGKEVFPSLLELVYHCIKNPRQLKEKDGDFVYFRLFFFTVMVFFASNWFTVELK